MARTYEFREGILGQPPRRLGWLARSSLTIRRSSSVRWIRHQAIVRLPEVQIRSKTSLPSSTLVYQNLRKGGMSHSVPCGVYNYLRKRIGVLDYPEYRRNHLPIGSGVTEAACKTVFTQRLKQSGMTWSLEGGQWIVNLRVIQLSGIWTQVYQAYLQAKILPEMGTRQGSRKKEPRKGDCSIATGADSKIARQ